MLLRDWNDLPASMKTDSVFLYYQILQRKKVQLVIKRIFDIICAFLLIILTSPIMLLFAIWIKLDSKGAVFYRQERVTQYGEVFLIFKFRTMIDKADKIGSSVTLKKDNRITKVGKKIRKYRIDELPQLFNVIKGEMTFVGTRPEIRKYVAYYTDEMYATLLLPAGITSLASLKFKDENRLLHNANNADKIYIEHILPKKMDLNLQAMKEFSFFYEMKICFETILGVIK